MLIVATNQPASRGAIKSMRLGPFLVHDVSVVFPSGDVGGGTKGVPCHVSGPIRSIDGNPGPGARIECGRPMHLPVRRSQSGGSLAIEGLTTARQGDDAR